MTREIPVTQAREELADLINRVAYGHERIVLTRHSRAVACIVPPEDLAALEDRERDAADAADGGQGEGQGEADGQRDAPVTYIGLGSGEGDPSAPGQAPAPGTAPGGLPLAARHQPPGGPRSPGA